MLLKKKRIKIRKKISITFNRIFYPTYKSHKHCDTTSCVLFFEYTCKLQNIARKYGILEPYLCEFVKFSSTGGKFTYIPDCDAFKEI